MERFSLQCGTEKRRIGTNIKTPDFIDDYKFYLALENSICRDYITEKFYKVLPYSVIPVVRGTKIRCKNLSRSEKNIPLNSKL